MKKTKQLMYSWNLEHEVKLLPDNPLKAIINQFIKEQKAGGIQSMTGILYRSNLQYILEHIDKTNLIDEIRAIL